MQIFRWTKPERFAYLLNSITQNRICQMAAIPRQQIVDAVDCANSNMLGIPSGDVGNAAAARSASLTSTAISGISNLGIG